MYEQIKLDYEFSALEPYIDTLTMETHYSKHHATYTKQLNDLANECGFSDKCPCEVLRDLSQVPEDKRMAVRNNGGGFYNHNLYFDIMSPNPKKAPEGELKDKIDATFGSVEKLYEELTKLALSQFGSGWAFLSVTKDGSLVTSKSPNQDNPLIEGTKNTPIIGIDVWEHAYYLKYKNLRADYVKNFFEVLDWSKVEERYNKFK